MRSLFTYLLLIFVLSAARPSTSFAGWVEDRAGETIIHVRLFNLPDPSRTDTATRADVEAVREFVRRFPAIFAERYRTRYQADPARYGRHNWDNVRIELHRFSGIQVEGVESALLAIAGGVSPDVIYVNFRQSDTYIQQGFLYPLDRPEDRYLAGMTATETEFRIHSKIWPVIRRPGPDGATHVWAIPFGGALGRVVLYRRDLFDDAGVPYPTNNWTWDDFLHACRKITDPARGIYGLGIGRNKHESWYWTSFLWSAGGDILAQDSTNGPWRAVFASPAAAVALDFYTRLCTEPWTDARGIRHYGYVRKDSGESFQRWERGQTGMVFAYIDEKVFSVINPDTTGMAPVPIGPTGQRGSELNSRMMGLFAGIREPAVRDAAWEYIRFYDSPEAARIKTRIMVEGGLGRFLNPRYLKEFGYPEFIRLAPRGWEECFRIAIESGRPEPYGRDSNYIYDILTRPIRQAEEMALAGELPTNRAERLDTLAGLLAQAERKANDEMLGLIPRGERLRRDAAAVALLAGIVLVFAWAIRRVIRAFRRNHGTRPDSVEGLVSTGGAPVPRLAAPMSDYSIWRRLDAHLRRYGMAYLLLAPAGLTIFIWHYLPLLRGSVMAFQDYRVMGGSQWAGLRNLGDVLWSPDWWRAIWTSARYSALVIAMTFLPPVILAVLLQEVPRGKIVFRILFYLPAVMSGLVIILLWKSFYDPSDMGLLNALLARIPAGAFLLAGLVLAAICLLFARRLFQHQCPNLCAGFMLAALGFTFGGLKVIHPTIAATGGYLSLAGLLAPLPEPVRWLDDSRTALFSCVLPLMWAGMGPGSLIYLAALKSIPDEFYEAADLDGATFIDKILFVVFPALKPLLIINFVGVFIAAWNAEANILAMTGGTADTEVAGLHIFYKAFIFLKFGPATAMAWMLGFMLIGFTMYQLQILSRLEFRTTERT